MRKLLQSAAAAAGALVLLVAAALAYVAATGIPRYAPQKVELKVEATPERVARGKRIAEMLCADCHFDERTGTLAGRRMPDLPPQFGVAYAANITRDPETGIGSWTDGEIAYLLRTGIARDGRYAPPWMVKLPLMSDEDLFGVIAFLRSEDPLVRAVQGKQPPSQPSLLTKVLARTAFKPLAYPAAPVKAPAPEDKVAYGRYLAQGRLLCFGCHSADFAKVDDLVPENSAGFFGGGNAMPDMNGRVVLTSNITPDEETGIGKWSEDEFVRALRFGVRPDNTPLVYPMMPAPLVSDEEARAIHAYLRTVPKLRNAVARPTPTVVQGAEPGRAAYYRYSCNSCHGDTGKGAFDLRQGHQDYATDAELIAYIRNPERFKPGIRMPTWDGVIAEQDYAPLAAYVRRLGKEPYRAQ